MKKPAKEPVRRPKNLHKMDVALWDQAVAYCNDTGIDMWRFVENAIREKLARDAV